MIFTNKKSIAVMEEDRYIIQGPEPFESLPSDTLAQLFYKHLLNADQKRVIMTDAHTGQELTVKTLLDEACNLAEALRQHACDNSTILSICSENNLHFFTTVLASLFAGTVLAPLNHNYTTEERKHKFNLIQPKIIFCSKTSYAKYLEMQKTLKYIEKVLVIDSDESIAGVETVGDFIKNTLQGKLIQSSDFIPFDGNSRTKTAFILCSSGTTGLPKGVMLSHYNVVARMMQSRDPQYLTTNDPVLGLMPFFHAYGLFFGLSSILNLHHTIMMDKFEEDYFLKTIQDYKISAVRIIPPLAIFLAKTPKVFNYDLSSVDEVFSAAAPLSAETEKELKKRLNIKMVHQAYGCTEATLAITIMNKEVERPGSCGRVITYMVCIVRDPETGKLLPPYAVGELCCKGPTVMLGYFRNKTATKESFTTDNWLRTGDLGYYDDEQYFYIVDRLKDVIKYKGFQVAPAELEAILVNNPKVLEAGVVGLPDEYAGELPLAFVVKYPGVEVTEKELQDYVAEKVSPQKKLRGGVIFLQSIPRTPSGKIQRKDLKKIMHKYRKQKISKL